MRVDFQLAPAERGQEIGESRIDPVKFYACKPYAEIYEEAFGKALSFKDPERAKLCRRLDRWIDVQFSRSAKGKAALKQGAARR